VLSGNTTSLQEDDEDGELDWDNVQVGLVFSSFSWGYMTTQILGGRLAELYGFKKIYGVGTFLPGLLMFFHPIAARTDGIVNVGVGCSVTEIILTLGLIQDLSFFEQSIGYSIKIR